MGYLPTGLTGTITATAFGSKTGSKSVTVSPATTVAGAFMQTDASGKAVPPAGAPAAAVEGGAPMWLKVGAVLAVGVGGFLVWRRYKKGKKS